MSALHDPKPGDVVEVPKHQRIVDRVDGGNIVYRRSRTGVEMVCWITTWREWCRKNDAREVGK